MRPIAHTATWAPIADFARLTTMRTMLIMPPFRVMMPTMPPIIIVNKMTAARSSSASAPTTNTWNASSSPNPAPLSVNDCKAAAPSQIPMSNAGTTLRMINATAIAVNAGSNATHPGRTRTSDTAEIPPALTSTANVPLSAMDTPSNVAVPASSARAVSCCPSIRRTTSASAATSLTTMTIGTLLSACSATSISIADAANGHAQITTLLAAKRQTRNRAYRSLILMFLFLPLAVPRMLTCVR